MDENQNVQGMQIPSLTQQTRDFLDFQKRNRQETATQNYLRRAKGVQDLTVTANSVDDPNIKTACDQMTRATQVGNGINTFYYDGKSTLSTELINPWVSAVDEFGNQPNMQYGPLFADYIKNGSVGGGCDPTELYAKMGWITPYEEHQLTAEEDEPSWIKKFWDNIWYPFEQVGWANRSLADWIMSYTDPDAVTMNALSEMVFQKFGKSNLNKLTEEEWAAVEKYMEENPDWKEIYKGTPQRTITKMAEGGLVAAMDTNPWALLINLAFSGLSATPYLEYGPMAIGWLAGISGYIMNALPGLYQFKMSLQTEEEREERDQFLGMLGLAKIFGKKNTKSKGGNDKGFFGKVWDWSNPETIIGDVIRRFEDWKKFPKWIRETPNRIMNSRESKVQNDAGKITNAETLKEKNIASRALSNLDETVTENIKTYQDLYDALFEKSVGYEALEDSIYDLDPRRFTQQDTIKPVKYTNDQGYSTYEITDPIGEGFSILKSLYENGAERAAVDMLEQQYLNEGLTKSQMNRMARAIAQGYDTYLKNKVGEPKTNLTAEYVEGVRKSLKRLAREGYEQFTPEFGNALEYIDSLWSDNINTRGLISDIQNQIVKAESQIPNKNILQKSMGALGKIINKAGVYDLFKSIVGKLKGKDAYDPLSRQSSLNSLLKHLQKLNNKLKKANGEKQIQSAIDEFNKAFTEEFGEIESGPIEGEVVGEKTSNNRTIERKRNVYDSNKYLEDIVQEAEPTKKLPVNPEYNGQEPIDYSTPTRVTPEGYAARWGQTLEGRKNALKEAGMNDAAIEEVLELVEGQNYIQQGLFGPSINMPQ